MSWGISHLRKMWVRHKKVYNGCLDMALSGINMTVSGTLVAVSGTLVAVSGTLVAVSGTLVAVSGTLVAVSGTFLAGLLFYSNLQFLVINIILMQDKSKTRYVPDTVHGYWVCCGLVLYCNNIPNNHALYQVHTWFSYYLFTKSLQSHLVANNSLSLSMPSIIWQIT